MNLSRSLFNRRGLSSSRTAYVKVIGMDFLLIIHLLIHNHLSPTRSHAPPAAPPSLQSPGLPSQSLKQDQRLSILCSITAGDEPIVMSWQKDGEPILAGQDSGVEITMIEHDSILRISRLQGRHMGNYSCRADNEAGTAVVHSFIQVKGMFASF